MPEQPVNGEGTARLWKHMCGTLMKVRGMVTILHQGSIGSQALREVPSMGAVHRLNGGGSNNNTFGLRYSRAISRDTPTEEDTRCLRVVGSMGNTFPARDEGPQRASMLMSRI